MRSTSTAIDRYTVEIESLLHTVGSLTKRQQREIMTNMDITPPQADALLALQEYGALAMGELCQKLGTACSTATDLIDRMERNGFVERVRDTNDRRVIRLKITDKGTEVIERVVEASRAHLTEQLQEMDLADKERLIQSLEQLQFMLTRS